LCLPCRSAVVVQVGVVVAGLVAVNVVTATEMLIQLGVVGISAAHLRDQAGDILHHCPCVDPMVAFGPSIFRISPRAIGLLALHETGFLVEQVLIVERAMQEEFEILGLAERFRYLGYAPVIVRVFECAGCCFRGLVGRDVARHALRKEYVVRGHTTCAAYRHPEGSSRLCRPPSMRGHSRSP